MKYQITHYSSLAAELQSEWETEWKISELGHIFNSPYWYSACVKVEPKQKQLILACRDNEGKLKGLLPLIYARKFGFMVYLSPGHKYLDKSTLFLTEYSSEIIKLFLDTLSEIGSYYLTEVNEQIALDDSIRTSKVETSICSKGRFLELGDSPLRNLSSENRRRLSKRLREDSTLSFKPGSKDLHENISIAREIEIKSTKARNHKDIFSDPYLILLCEQINNVSPGLIEFSFLYQGKEAICYKYGFMTHGIYHYSNTAYKLSHQKLSPGRLLMISVFDYLLKHEINNVDFSRGDTPFKRDFSDNLYRQYTLFKMNNSLSMWVWKIMFKVKILINL